MVILQKWLCFIISARKRSFVFNAKCQKWVCLIKDLGVFWFWIISSLMNSSMFFENLVYLFASLFSFQSHFYFNCFWFINCCCCFEGWCKLGTVLSVSLPFIGEVFNESASAEGQWYRLKEQYCFKTPLCFIFYHLFLSSRTQG